MKRLLVLVASLAFFGSAFAQERVGYACGQVRFVQAASGAAAGNQEGLYWRYELAVRELERSVRELGLKGAKFHPGRQEFYPNDRRFAELFDTAANLGVPVLFHTGMLAAGAGTPGGRGQRLDYTRPIYLDHLAADFPSLTIIAAHPSWPWADEALAVARHKSNVFLDLSGYSPKYIPPQYVQFANTLLQDQMLFGSDYPFITPERWLADFAGTQ